MRARPLIVLLSAVVVLAAGWFLFRDSGDAPAAAIENGTTAQPAKSTDAAPLPATAVAETKRDTALPESAPIARVTGDESLPAAYRRGLGILVGRVVEADHTPVKDIGVELIGASIEELLPDVDSMFDVSPALSPVLAGTKTDDDGRFQFEGVEPSRFHGLAIDAGGARATIRVVDTVPLVGATTDLGEFVLEPFITVTGRVVDESDRPIAGARVRATNLPGIIFQFGAADFDAAGAIAGRDFRSKEFMVIGVPAWARGLFERLPIPATKTDADGKFTLAGVPQGQSTVVVDFPGLLALSKGPLPTGKAGNVKDLGTLVLEAGETLNGKVVTGDGKPVANAQILVGNSLTGGMMGAPTFMKPYGTTDANGAFVAGGLRDVKCLVAVKAQDALDWKVFDEITPGIDEPVLKLDTPVDLKVIALDSAGKPLAKADLMLRLGSDPAEVPLVIAPIPVQSRTTVNPDGSRTVSHLEPKKYDLLVRSEGFATGVAEVDLTAGPQTVTVKLEPEASLAVRVVAAGKDGEALEHARVRVFRGRELWKHGDIPVASARTDGAGRATLKRLTPGKTTIEVDHPDYATERVEADVPGDEVEVALLRGGGIKGRLHRGGEPVVEPRFVILELKNDHVKLAVSKLDGTFEMNRVPAGDWRIEVFPRFLSGAPSAIVSELEGLSSPEARRRVTVVEGADVDVDIDLLGSPIEGPTAQLRGRVLMNGSPLADASVWFHPQGNWNDRKSVRTDESGRFDLAVVQAGNAQVNVDPKNSRGGYMGFWTKNLSLKANEVRELVIDLNVGAISGIVVDEGGKPVALATVQVMSGDPWEMWSDDGKERAETDGSRNFAQTEADGRFSIEPVMATKVSVQVFHEAYANSERIEADVPARGAPPELRIVLRKGVTASGTIEFPADVDKSNTMVWCQSVNEGEEFSSNVEYDAKTGTFSIPNISPGKFRMNAWVQTESRMLEPIEFEVPPGGFSGRRLQMKRPANEGKVQATDGG